MQESEQVLEQRTKSVLQFLKTQKNLLIYIAVAFVLWVGFFIRTRNLGNIIDVTINQPVPIEPDSFAFLRYAKYILDHGSMLLHDTMRYFPNGYDPASEFSFLSHTYVWLYKFLHFFNPDVSLNFAQVVYPPLAFVAGGIIFFLLVRRLFDWRVALLATAFLSVIPAYISRTVTGFSDKEALGMVFLFLSLYLYVCAFQSKTLTKGLIFGFFAGLTTAVMGLAWGGVQFIFFIIGMFALYELIFDYFTEHDFYSYAAWLISALVFLTFIFATRFTFLSFITTETLIPAVLAFLVGICKILIVHFNPFQLKSRLHGKLPFGIFNFFFSGIVLLLVYIPVRGFSVFIATIKNIFTGLLNPYGASRWGRTVAESHQPFIREWFSQFGNFYFWLFLIGAVVLFFATFSIVKKYRYHLTGVFVVFLSAFMVSRYSSAPPFDGESPLAKFLYFGSMLLLFGSLFFLYIYTHRKKQDSHADLSLVKKEYLFVLAWMLVMIISSRVAVRILFVFAPFTAIPVAFLFVRAYDLGMTLKYKIAKGAVILVLLYFLLSPIVSASLLSSYTTSYNSVRGTGSSYNQQWQYAMKWVRENTPQDAVFAHWWDYGYYVQTGGERATITDGGNNGGTALNYFMGRNVLTGRNNTEALEFLKAKGASHLLIVSDEIGKYGAFSSIGSNLTYDRYSMIPAFSLDPSQSTEQRNQTLLFYRGNVGFDEDISYHGTLYPAYSSGVGAVVVPITMTGNNSIINQPQAIVIYKGQQQTIPLKCLFVNNKELIFPGEALNACFQIIPLVQGNSAQVFGAGLYLSGKVWNTLFTHLYLFNQTWDGFSLAYNDEQSLPLAAYNSMIAGPLKIWKIDYPPTMAVNPFYERLDLPDQRLAYV